LKEEKKHRCEVLTTDLSAEDVQKMVNQRTQFEIPDITLERFIPSKGRYTFWFSDSEYGFTHEPFQVSKQGKINIYPKESDADLLQERVLYIVGKLLNRPVKILNRNVFPYTRSFTDNLIKTEPLLSIIIEALKRIGRRDLSDGLIYELESKFRGLNVRSMDKDEIDRIIHSLNDRYEIIKIALLTAFDPKIPTVFDMDLTYRPKNLFDVVSTLAEAVISSGTPLKSKVQIPSKLYEYFARSSTKKQWTLKDSQG